jgi:predicted dehydrogenase
MELWRRAGEAQALALLNRRSLLLRSEIVAMLSSRVRIGLVGVGLHGMRYARHIARDVSEAHLVALTRRDHDAGRAQAAELGCAYEPDVAELASREDVDAVVVVTPPAAHLEAVLLSLHAGKAVLVEKPMVANVQEAEELRQVASDASQPVMVAQTLRYNVVLRTIRAQLPALGRIVQVRMSQRLEPSPLAWQREHQSVGAGSILLTGVHLFDAVRWLFDDEVTEVFCRSRQVQNPSNEDFFAASVVLTRSRIHVDLEVSKYTHSRSCRIEVVGEAGQFLGDYWNHRLFFASGRDERLKPLPPEVFTVEAAVGDFCQRLVKGREMPITVVDGLRSLEIAEACYASARSDSVITLATPVSTKA